MTRTIFLIVISFMLIATGSLNAFEVKFTPQAPSTDYKTPVTTKMPAAQPADKIIVKEPLKISDEVMTKPLPYTQPKYQPEPVAPIIEAEESGSGQGFAQEMADSPLGGTAEQGNAEESMLATPAGQPMPAGPSQALPLGQGVQSPATQTAGAAPSGQAPAGGCGGPILAGIIMDTPQEDAADQSVTEGEYQYENAPPQYYYEEQPATGTRPPGIYFHEEEGQQEEVEE